MIALPALAFPCPSSRIFWQVHEVLVGWIDQTLSLEASPLYFVSHQPLLLFPLSKIWATFLRCWIAKKCFSSDVLVISSSLLLLILYEKRITFKFNNTLYLDLELRFHLSSIFWPYFLCRYLNLMSSGLPSYVTRPWLCSHSWQFLNGMIA